MGHSDPERSIVRNLADQRGREQRLIPDDATEILSEVPRVGSHAVERPRRFRPVSRHSQREHVRGASEGIEPKHADARLIVIPAIPRETDPASELVSDIDEAREGGLELGGEGSVDRDRLRR
jgi:hypothetical protein